MQRGGRKGAVPRRIGQAARRQGMLTQAMPVLKQDQFAAIKLAHRHALVLQKGVAMGGRGQDLVAGDTGIVEARHIIGQCNQGRIETAGFQRRNQPRG